MIPLHGIYLAARQAARSCMRGKRLLALLTLAALPPIVVIANRVFEGGTMGAGMFHNVVLMLAFQFTIPFSALLLGVGVLGDELEGRTITYLWTRPVGRGWIYLGRYLGSAFGYALILVPSMLVALYAQEPAPDLEGAVRWRPVVIGLGGFLTYLAVFALLRTLLQRALVAGMFYILIVDLAVAQIPRIGAVKLSLWHYMAVIHTSAFDPGSARVLARVARTIAPGETAGSSAMVLLVVGVVALVAGMVMVRVREYPVAGAVA